MANEKKIIAVNPKESDGKINGREAWQPKASGESIENTPPPIGTSNRPKITKKRA